MSRIYDALIQAGKRRDLRRSDGDDKVEPLSLWWRDLSIEWKITGTVAAVMLVFGLLLLIIAHQLMGRGLQSEIDQRTVVMATNLSDAAAGHVIRKNILELSALLTKYARLEGAAYAFIEDSNGQIVAHSLRPLPPELQAAGTADERKQIYRRVVTLEGKTVYETSVPMLEGQLGAAHLGIWAEGVKTELNRTRLPFLGWVTFLLLVAVIVAAFIVRSLIAPIAGPTDIVAEASRDELKTAIENKAAGIKPHNWLRLSSERCANFFKDFLKTS
jgi:sensor histidine kinase regulating citrate/malate metabolism